MIFAGNIPNFLQFNVLFIAIYIKNKRPIKALNSILLYKKFKGKPPLIYYLQALVFTIYSLITKKDYIKLARFTL